MVKCLWMCPGVCDDIISDHTPSFVAGPQLLPIGHAHAGV